MWVGKWQDRKEQFFGGKYLILHWFWSIWPLKIIKLEIEPIMGLFLLISIIQICFRPEFEYSYAWFFVGTIDDEKQDTLTIDKMASETSDKDSAVKIPLPSIEEPTSEGEWNDFEKYFG